MKDRQGFGVEDRRKELPVQVAAGFSSRKARITGQGVVAYLFWKIVGVHGAAVDKHGFTLMDLHCFFCCLQQERSLVCIIDLEPVVPVPWNMMAYKQTPLIIVADKGQAC